MRANLSRALTRLLALSLPCAGAFGCGDETSSLTDAAIATDAATDAGTPDAGNTEGLEVTTSLGKVQGKLVGSTRAFLGIPYAKPPVGARRFLPPEAPEPWSGTKVTTAFGPSCPQTTIGLPAQGPQSEDCLTLNVYTPMSPATKLPVMVWIHGGAFVSGGAVMYDGGRLSREGPAVVVSLNYRLGALGLLAHPLLDQERGSTPSGNDALRDQQLALTFVRDNIAAFGGDPDNVTLFGESAGSMSTCVQMLSPTAQTLAQRHIMQSGSCIAGLRVERKATGDALGARFAEAFCAGRTDVLACLREKDASALVAWAALEGISGAGWAPVFNAADPLMPKHPIALITESTSTRPLIIGTNKNEWALFIALRPEPLGTVDELKTAMNIMPVEVRADVIAHYVTPSVTDATARDVFIRMMTDAFFRCPSRGLARLATERGKPVYLYSFEEGAAFHGLDVPYVFGNPVPALGVTDTEAVHAVFQSYFLPFVKTGDPNGAAAVRWPVYDAVNDRHLVITSTPVVGEHLAKDDCDFWDSIFSRIP